MGVLWNSVLFSMCLVVMISPSAQSAQATKSDLAKPENPPFQPMVAFICNRSAMFNEPDGGWVSDMTTDCLREAKDILDYCRRVFPSQHITHFREANKKRVIPGWCAKGSHGGLCKGFGEFRVRPILCLPEAKSSPSTLPPSKGKVEKVPQLVVPIHCNFDHQHDATRCDTEQMWKRRAQKACGRIYGMRLLSSAMFSACGNDEATEGKAAMYNGVEYVCCPVEGKKKAVVTATSTLLPPVVHMTLTTGMDDALSKKKLRKVDYRKKWKQLKGKKDFKDKGEQGVKASVADTYMKEKTRRVEYKGEHKMYQAVLAVLKKDKQEKVDKLLKTWEEGKKMIAAVKDPRQSAKMNREETEMFQASMAKVNADSEARLGEAMKIHQAHVYTNFNERKRSALSKYISRLEMYSPSEEKSLLHALKRYLYLEQKDARHCIQHYKVVKTSHPSLAPALLQPTIHHLETISKRMNQSINLLSRLDDPKAVAHLRGQVESWFQSSFLTIDAAIKRLIWTVSNLEPATSKGAGKGPVKTPVVKAPVETERQEMERKPKPKLTVTQISMKTLKEMKDRVKPTSLLDKMKRPGSLKVVQKGKSTKVDADDNGPLSKVSSLVKAGMEKWSEVKASKLDRVLPLKPVPPVIEDTQEVEMDDLIAEDEHDYMKAKPDHREKAKDVILSPQYEVKASASLAQVGHSSAKEGPMIIAKSDLEAKALTPGSIVAIVSSLIASVLLVAVVVATVRSRRSSEGLGTPVGQPSGEYMEVAGEELTPEEMHVKKMQMNGYENPTYKFLEGTTQ